MQNRFCWQQSTAQNDASCTSNTDFTKKLLETSTTSMTETRVRCSNAQAWGIRFLLKSRDDNCKALRKKKQKNKNHHHTKSSHGIPPYTHPPTPTLTTKSKRGQQKKEEEKKPRVNIILWESDWCKMVFAGAKSACSCTHRHFNGL